MNNGLESKLSDGVRRILSRQNAYAANALANAGDYDGARAALDKFARDNNDYANLGPSIEALAVSDEATKRAAELYGKQWNEILDNSTVLDFLSYLDVSEGYNLLNMSEGGRRLLNSRMEPIKHKKIGELKRDIERAYKILEEVEKTNNAHIAQVEIDNAYRTVDNYGILLESIRTLTELNNSSLQQKAVAKASN